MDMPELPFSVKPEKKVSIRDMFRLYRETYAGTEYDAGQEPAWSRGVRRCGPRGGQPRGQPPPATPAPAPEMVQKPAGPALDVGRPGPAGQRPQAGHRHRAADDRHQRLRLRHGPPVPRLAASGGRHGLLVRFRQSRPERPLPDLRRRHRAAAELRDLRPAPLPDGLGRLDVPERQPAGDRSNGARPRRSWRTRSASSRRRGCRSCRSVEKALPEILSNSKTPDKEPFKPTEYLTQYTNDFAPPR